MATLVNISITGYTEAGHEAAFDFTAASDNVQAEMIDAMNQLWLAGVTPNLPGWINRHDFEVCDTVLLREQENTDGSRTPIVTMYTVKPYLNHKFLHEYLNTPADVEEFEQMIGRSLDKFPLYPGTTSPERGKRQQDAAFFIKVNPFGVLKRIPEAGEGDDAREKHRLVRFIPMNSESPTGNTPAPSAIPPAVHPARAVKDAGNALNAEPTPDLSFDEQFPRMASNPYNKDLPATTQPAQTGLLPATDDGTRSADEIVLMCQDFYAWLGRNHMNLTKSDAHDILEVDSAKVYFATHSLEDAQKEVLAYQKGLSQLKKASGQ